MKRSHEIQAECESNKRERGDDLLYSAAEEDILANKTDSEFVLEDIASSNSATFVFVHMIHQVLSANKSIVDEEILYMRKELHNVKLLHCSDLLASVRKDSAADLSALIPTAKMLRSVEDVREAHNDLIAQSALDKFSFLLRGSDLVAVSHQTLLGKVKEEALTVSVAGLPTFSEEEIECLVSASFLRRRLAIQGCVDSFYWISHPQLFQVVQRLRDVQEAVLVAIRRTKYKELTAKQVVKIFASVKPRRDTADASLHFKWRYHLLDLTGRSVLKKVEVPGNSADHYILRLPVP